MGCVGHFSDVKRLGHELKGFDNEHYDVRSRLTVKG